MMVPSAKTPITAASILVSNSNDAFIKKMATKYRIITKNAPAIPTNIQAIVFINMIYMKQR